MPDVPVPALVSRLHRPGARLADASALCRPSARFKGGSRCIHAADGGRLVRRPETSRNDMNSPRDMPDIPFTRLVSGLDGPRTRLIDRQPAAHDADVQGVGRDANDIAGNVTEAHRASYMRDGGYMVDLDH